MKRQPRRQKWKESRWSNTLEVAVLRASPAERQNETLAAQSSISDALFSTDQMINISHVCVMLNVNLIVILMSRDHVDQPWLMVLGCQLSLVIIQELSVWWKSFGAGQKVL